MLNNASHSSSAQVTVDAPSVRYTDADITAAYEYSSCLVSTDDSGHHVVTPKTSTYLFSTARSVPRLGVMLVGWGGNNGSTLTAAALANKHKLSWETREGVQTANYLGSLVMSSTVKLGVDARDMSREVFTPLRSLVPMVHPDDIVFGGWDISSADLAAAVDRARVLEPDLRRQLRPALSQLKPLPSVYYPDFIASNQESRADNLIPGTCKAGHLAALRSDIRNFKALHNLDKVIVLWTANTEKYCDIIDGVNTTADDLLNSINASHPEVSPSTLFAVAAILENSCFINGSPQNTLIPGVVELAARHGVHVAGDDFKSGQTKLKSVLVDFLVNAGIKPLGIASYNHLGNNDGLNLSEAAQFRSKEISKSSVVDDMVHSNKIMYPNPAVDAPDHVVVIKYLPAVGDSKRALDEYYSEIFMGGRNTLTLSNICEDSLLACPLIIDLVVLCELFSRVRLSVDNGQEQSFHTVLSPLSYMLKAPMAPPGTPVINSLFRQRACIESLLRALVGLPVNNEANLEWKCARLNNNKMCL